MPFMAMFWKTQGCLFGGRPFVPPTISELQGSWPGLSKAAQLRIERLIEPEHAAPTSVGQLLPHAKIPKPPLHWIATAHPIEKHKYLDERLLAEYLDLTDTCHELVASVFWVYKTGEKTVAIDVALDAPEQESLVEHRGN